MVIEYSFQSAFYKQLVLLNTNIFAPVHNTVYDKLDKTLHF